MALDEKRMTRWIPELATFFALGCALGVLYFGSLWWSADLFARPGRMGATIAVTAGRFALLGGILTLVSLAGAMLLLMTALGILGGRALVMRRVRQASA
jgi:hypothetical protein